MKIKNRQHILAFVAIGGLAILAADKLVLTPLAATWKERSTRITALEQSVNQGSLLLDRENAIRDRWESMRTNTLPSDISAAENKLLRAFERWAADSRISITSIKPQWKRGSEEHWSLECRADAFGGIEALTRFLYNVEKDPLALKVEALEITARDNSGQQLALGLQVSGLLLNPSQP